MRIQPTEDGIEKSQPSSISLIATIGDTTWRMFVPTISLLLIGNYGDEYFHTAPWLMLTGALVGGCLAAVLIKRQLAKDK